MYYYSTNFPVRNIVDEAGRIMTTISDVLTYYVRRAISNLPDRPVYPSYDDPRRFKSFVSRLPVLKQEGEYSFPLCFDEHGDLRTTVFDRFWSCKDDTKNPGAPLNFCHVTNSDCEPRKAEIYEEVNFRIKSLIRLGKNVWDDKLFERELSVSERTSLVFDWNLCDPIAVNIKAEPRKIGKMPRLISMASLTDNLTTRVAYHNLLVDTQDSPEVFMATRLDITTQEQTHERWLELKKRGMQTQNDVQGWEYSMNASDHWACTFVDAYMLGLMDDSFNLTGYTVDHFYLLMGLSFTLINRMTLLPEGKLILLPPGQMPSGILITYHRNSFCRALLADNVSWDNFGKPVESAMTAGDDCVDTNNFPSVEESYQAHLKYGKVVTDVYTNDEIFEFCSTVFMKEKSYQTNIAKSAYAILIDKRGDSEALAQFDANYSNHPEFVRYRDELVDLLSKLQ